VQVEPSSADPPSRRPVTRTALGALVVGAIALAACVSGLDRSDVAQSGVAVEETVSVDSALLPVTTTPTGPPTSTSDSEVVPEGFITALVEITKDDGEVCEVCVWLADSSADRGQGLMGVTSLGTPEAMAFVWDRPTSGAFFMFQTVTPLSIAWFDTDGLLVSTADMDPCLSDDSADCERFRADGQYVLALEVFQGDLASIGITDGARVRLLPGTEAADCPLA